MTRITPILKPITTIVLLIVAIHLSLTHQLTTYYTAILTQLPHLNSQVKNEIALSKRLIALTHQTPLAPLTDPIALSIHQYENSQTLQDTLNAIHTHHTQLAHILTTLSAQNTPIASLITQDLVPIYTTNTQRLEAEWMLLTDNINWYSQKLTQFPYTLTLKFTQHPTPPTFIETL